MRSTRAEINTKNLIENYYKIRKKSNNVDICAAVKADGYGHGSIEVSRLLEEAGCSFFGVATVYEAEELIQNGIKKPIILFSLPIPAEIKYIVSLNIEPIVTTLELIDLFEIECQRQSKSLNIHLKIDTGMGRIGCTPKEGIILAKRVWGSKKLKLKGLCTHLSTSELDNQDYTNLQISRFRSVIDDLKANGIQPQYFHCANSGGILKNSTSIFNLVRTGINLYGYPPTKNSYEHLDLKPVMELLSKVVELKKVDKGTPISYGRTYITSKETYIATIPVGYADGYFRALSNKGEVSINGKLYPVVGNICMDQMMVEVDSSIKLYDDVILIGIGKDLPNAESIAKKIGTISYEILTNIHRVKRYYNK